MVSPYENRVIDSIGTRLYDLNWPRCGSITTIDPYSDGVKPIPPTLFSQGRPIRDVRTRVAQRAYISKKRAVETSTTLFLRLLASD